MEHLTCNICGYKQYDENTVKIYANNNPEESLHDIYYVCGSCQDNNMKEKCHHQ